MAGIKLDIYKNALNPFRFVPKQESFEEYSNRSDAEKARQMFTGHGREYGITKGLEGMDTTVNMLGTAAIPMAKGTKDTTDNLPQVNKQIWEDASTPEGEMELKNVAGGEGQSYGTTKASTNTEGLSAAEYQKAKKDLQTLRNDLIKSLPESLDEDTLSDFEVEQVQVPANDAKKQAKVKGAMFQTTGQKMEAAQKAGFETTSEHRQAAKDAYDENKYMTYDVPKDPKEIQAKENTKEWGKEINKGKSHDRRYEDTRKENTNDANIWKGVEDDFLPRVYEFFKMIERINPELAKKMQDRIPYSKDAKISMLQSYEDVVPEEGKTLIKEDLRNKAHQDVADNLRKKDAKTGKKDTEKEVGRIGIQLGHSFESLKDKALYDYASVILGKPTEVLKQYSKRGVAALLGNMVAQLMYAEDFDDKKESSWTTDSQWQSKANAEMFNDFRGPTAEKYAPVFINDWLNKFSINDVADEDKDTYKRLSSLMKGYNSSRGNRIRSSDSVPKNVLSDPAFVEMFEKYNDPVMNSIR